MAGETSRAGPTLACPGGVREREAARTDAARAGSPAESGRRVMSNHSEGDLGLVQVAGEPQRRVIQEA